jgi:hypothetical protein
LLLLLALLCSLYWFCRLAVAVAPAAFLQGGWLIRPLQESSEVGGGKRPQK